MSLKAPWSALFPFRSHYLDRDGVRMHYIEEGWGEPVVMLHGNPTWSFMYRDLVLALKESYRCIAPDHIGMGLSDKPGDDRYDYTLESRVHDLEALLDHLHVRDNITLVLHDWGGMIGAAYAVRHPHRIQRLVVLNSAAFLPPVGKKLPWQLVLARNRVLGGLLVRGLNAFVLGAAHRCCSRRVMPPEVRQAYAAPYDSWDNRIAVHRFVQDIPTGPWDRSYPLVRVTMDALHRLKDKPALIVWGMKDFVFDHDFLAEWVRRFPGAEVERIPQAGHFILEDAPEIAIPRIARFLGVPYSLPEATR